jgi:hypothetical protein
LGGLTGGFPLPKQPSGQGPTVTKITSRQTASENTQSNFFEVFGILKGFFQKALKRVKGRALALSRFFDCGSPRING